MKTSDYFDSDSPYAKAADDPGFNKQGIIEETGKDVMSNDDGERKIIWVALSCLEKPVVLSKTNGRALRDAFGTETTKWHGQRVLVTTKRYNFDGNSSVGWITTPMFADDDFDDDIPFGDAERNEDENDTPAAQKKRRSKARRK